MKLTISQEFSIEIPDKDADTIHSGMSEAAGYLSNVTVA
jgi:acyl carrier protein